MFSRVMGGEAVPCWVDYKYRNDNKYSRDIAAIYKLDNGDIIIGARGIQYGYVDDWYTYDGMTAQEAFIIECERINLEY